MVPTGIQFSCCLCSSNFSKVDTSLGTMYILVFWFPQFNLCLLARFNERCSPNVSWSWVALPIIVVGWKSWMLLVQKEAVCTIWFFLICFCQCRFVCCFMPLVMNDIVLSLSSINCANLTYPHNTQVFSHLVRSFHLNRGQLHCWDNFYDSNVIVPELWVDIRFVYFNGGINGMHILFHCWYESPLGIG